jgi:hypothetical protein
MATEQNRLELLWAAGAEVKGDYLTIALLNLLHPVMMAK